MKTPLHFHFSRLLFAAIFLTICSNLLFAQPPGGGGGKLGGGQMNIGRFYGKVVDEKGKGVGYATVALYGMRFDTVSRSLKEVLLSGQITEENGDFSLENLPVMGDFTLKISFVGYGEVEKKVTFGIPLPTPGGGRPNGNRPPGTNPQGNGNQPNIGGTPGMGGGNFDASKFDVDLGNIPLVAAMETLQTVTITGESSRVTLALDRKVYRVDKDATATGGTAEDALKNVPSLSVDLDGNLTLRTAAPQLFVDGRPTTLSLDQIPADAIETVEVITNPSAKYDASGGQAGIVNIVLKKDRRIGYNGNVRAGVDTRGATNFGGDLNARDGKVNAFIGLNINRRRGISNSETERLTFADGDTAFSLQSSRNVNVGYFANARAGLDWFMNNRNTLTFSGNFTRGSFQPEDVLNFRSEALDSNIQYVRNSNTERNFRNLGGSMLFKHIFPKEGKEWTADLNYNRIKSTGEGNFATTYVGNPIPSNERQASDGSSEFITLQTDWVEPLSDRIKFEVGARAALRQQENNNYTYRENTQILTPFDQYSYEDNVYAVYGNFSHSFLKWGYQVGLRAESSQYTGMLPEMGDTTFSNDYPLSLFPSIFLTRKLNEEDNVQLSYSRRINRPNFFQLMPFIDFSDSLNLQQGNPDLLPEFTNSLEIIYQNIFKQGHNLLVSIYYKQATDLITRYSEPTDVPGVNLWTYRNANSSKAYGMEFTLRNTFWKVVELTSNINLYNSEVDASNVQAGLVNEQFTWFIKENMSIKLPANFTLQLTGEYRSRAAFSPSGGGGGGGGRFGGGGGGGGWGGGPTNTAQGYSLANWFMDAALRKDLLKRKATVTINIQDIFRTRRNGTHTEATGFVQDTWRVRDPQVVRVNFSYRFGKMDTSLFKRKNTRTNMDGSDMMQ